MTSLIYDIRNLKHDTNELIYETNKITASRWVAKGQGAGQDGVEAGASRHKLLYVERMSNKVFPSSMENYTQHPMRNHSGEERSKENN